MDPDPTQSVECLKELGNSAVKANQFEEAVLHYTHAIKTDSNNFTLYSNRSYAFLKLKQHTLAYEDACETIRLNPMWAKGYFRKGEVEYSTSNYGAARESYESALKLKPDDINLYDCVEKAKRAILKDIKADEQIPWLGSGIGIVIGVAILIADYVFTATPTHPLIMAFVTIAIAICGYGIAKLFRNYMKSQRLSFIKGLDEEKVEDIEEESDQKVPRNTRYTKSQARQRFKQGKK